MMLANKICVAATLLAAIPASVTQYFPPTPEGVTVLESKFGDGVTISYKEESTY